MYNAERNFNDKPLTWSEKDLISFILSSTPANKWDRIERDHRVGLAILNEYCRIRDNISWSEYKRLHQGHSK